MILEKFGKKNKSFLFYLSEKNMQKRKFPFLSYPKERKESVNTFWTESKVKEWMQKKEVLINQVNETNAFKIETISLLHTTKQQYNEICWAHNQSNCNNCLKKLFVDKLFCGVSQTSDDIAKIEKIVNQIKTKTNEISHYLHYDWKAHSHTNDKYSISYFRSKHTKCILILKKLNDYLNFISTYFGIFMQHCVKILYAKECKAPIDFGFTCINKNLQDIRITNIQDFRRVYERFTVQFALQNFEELIKQNKNPTINLTLDFAANKQERILPFIGNTIQNTYKQNMQFEMIYYIQYEIIIQGKKIVACCDDKIYLQDGLVAQVMKPLHTYINNTQIFFGYAFQQIFPIPSNTIFGINQGMGDKIQMLSNFFIKDIVKIILAYDSQTEFSLTKREYNEMRST